MTFDRRDFMVGTMAVAGGALLAPAIKFSTAQAATTGAASPGVAQAPAYYRTKVGSVTVTSLLDGGMTLADTLMLNAKPDTLAAAKAEHFLPKGNEFPAYVNGFVIDTGKKITLVDTGARGMADSLGHLIENLKAAGYAPEQVQEIIITHAHGDHTNGLLGDGGAPAFPKAQVRLASEELAFWLDDTQMAKYPDKKQQFEGARKNLSPYQASGQLQTFKLGADLGSGLSSIALPGHTPGHSGVRVSDGKDQLVIWADIVHVPALQFAHPEASIAFDTDPELARKTRQKIMAEVATDKIRIAGMHLTFPGLGHVAKRGSGYDFVPQRWETSL